MRLSKQFCRSDDELTLRRTLKCLKRVLSFTLFSLFSSTSLSAKFTYDHPVVNGHPGYLTAWNTQGTLDKVFLLVGGFDTQNDDHPKGALYDEYQALSDLLNPYGWDIIYFDYVDGSIDIKDNAENLSHFIKYLNRQIPHDYPLALVGGSMGGIVIRTMFVQEYSNLGADYYISIDSPHWGVKLSKWSEKLAEWLVDYPAAKQMLNTTKEFKQHYGWLQSVERDGTFLPTVIDPIHTCAISLSDGENGWETSWGDLSIHNKYYPVSSFAASKGLRSAYIPYHSTTYMDYKSTRRRLRLGYTRYEYKNTYSSYFDKKIGNRRTKHGAPSHVFKQAADYILFMEEVAKTLAINGTR